MEAQVSETRRIHRGILGGGSGQEAGVAVELEFGVALALEMAQKESGGRAKSHLR